MLFAVEYARLSADTKEFISEAMLFIDVMCVDRDVLNAESADELCELLFTKYYTELFIVFFDVSRTYLPGPTIVPNNLLKLSSGPPVIDSVIEL